MHRYRRWLLTLAACVLLAPSPLLAADTDSAVSGSVEAGGAGVNIKDDKARVNEYSTIRPDNGVTGYGKVDLGAKSQDGIVIDVKGDITGKDNQSYDVDVDLKRVLRGNFSFDKFQHWLDNDQMNYLNAGVPSGGVAGATLNGLVTSDPTNYTKTAITDAGTIGTVWQVPNFDWLDANNVPGFIGKDSNGSYYAFNPADPAQKPPATVNGETVSWQQIGRAGLYGENFMPNEDFSIIRREWKNNADLTLPQLPNLTFHAGYRVEQREGMEQSIGMSKCTSCHITGSGKAINEETKDFTAGVTGKFGLLTVDYAYLDREFREKAGSITRRYDPALAPNPKTTYSATNATFDNRLLYDYEDGSLPYDVTPDSDKTSHVVKARVDLPRNTMVLGSFVNAEARSTKTDEPGIFTLSRSKLKTTYDAYGLRAATRVGKNLTLTLRGKIENVDNDDVTITYVPMGTGTASLGSIDPDSLVKTRHSVISRDVATIGVDGVYRLARYTTLKLGYQFQDTDRDDDLYGETKTHTVTAAFKARPARTLTTRLNYTYKKTDHPFQNPDAALYVDPVTGLSYYDKNAASAGWDPGYLIGSGPTYGTDYYDLRQADLSNLPETSHEAKASATWAPRADFAATLSVRVKLEENELDHSKWKQQTYSPGVSFWYAPSSKVNVTFAYNYLGQRAESKFCQGWYDG